MQLRPRVTHQYCPQQVLLVPVFSLLRVSFFPTEPCCQPSPNTGPIIKPQPASHMWMDTCHLQFRAKGWPPNQQFRICFWGLVGPPCKSLPRNSQLYYQEFFSCAINYPAGSIAEKRWKRVNLLVSRRGKAWTRKEGKDPWS